MAIGIFFFFNNKNMWKGAAKFYKWLYTKKNLMIMFKVAGIVLFVGGIILMVVK